MELFKKLAVICPSKVSNKERYNFATASLESLLTLFPNQDLQIIVTHDLHKSDQSKTSKIVELLKQPYKWDVEAVQFYKSRGVDVLIGNNHGSAIALLNCVERAIERGFDFVFIHLDDHIYINNFKELIMYGCEFMEQEPKCLWSRFSGYPLIYNGPNVFNFQEQKLCFDGVQLARIAFPKYTSWVSEINDNTNQGRYWPVSMWFTIYRATFLREILKYSIDNDGSRHLANVEDFYKNKGGFAYLVDNYSEHKFAYINMQFGGFEFHRNKNWKELVNQENLAIL